MYDTQALRDTNLHPGSFRQVIVDNLISRMGLGSDGNISMQIAKKKKGRYDKNTNKERPFAPI